MAKYFFDCEFIEGFHKPLFGKRRHFIDLISIGIYCEDGRSYYAISSEFKAKDASEWVKQNVISKLPKREEILEYGKLYKSNDHIAADIIRFVYRPIRDRYPTFDYAYQHDELLKREDIQFFGYYSDYDWVVLCSLFGTMMSLPKGFPMYCRDIKQMVDEWVIKAIPDLQRHEQKTFTFEQALEKLKQHPDYPKEQNEHDAMCDARWNYDLYKFITGNI